MRISRLPGWYNVLTFQVPIPIVRLGFNNADLSSGISAVALSIGGWLGVSPALGGASNLPIGFKVATSSVLLRSLG